jgi:hypothetical protein
MEERLKSISRRISWSSLLRAVIFAAAWWVTPFWLFLIIALYLYYVPIAGAGKVSAPFWVLMLLSFLEPQGWLFAIVLGAVFYFILLIKDLLIIDRRTSYEVLVFVLSYLMMRGFFLHLGENGFGGWSFIGAVGVALVLTLLFRSFLGNFLPGNEAVPQASRPFRRAVGWIMFIVTWQLLIVGLFLPFNFFYQAAVIFLVLTALMSLVSQHAFGELNRTKTLATSMVVFVFLTIILASARWTL